MPDTPDPRSIAARLTAAQREMLQHLPAPCPRGISGSGSISSHGASPADSAMGAMGLVYSMRHSGPALSPLGVAVRAVLDAERERGEAL